MWQTSKIRNGRLLPNKIIEKGIQELFESDRYRNYLTIMSQFHVANDIQR